MRQSERRNLSKQKGVDKKDVRRQGVVRCKEQGRWDDAGKHDRGR